MSNTDEKRTTESFSSDEKRDPASVDVEDKISEFSDNVYDDSVLGKFFVPIESYEGYHRFDPKATWSEPEEKKVIRKIDWRIMLWCCTMFFALQMDRGNITFALTDIFLVDLGLNTNDYNNGQMIFYLCFMFAELPSQLVSKKLGPQVWCPIQLCLWSIVAMSQSRLSGRTSFFVTRAFLGLLEGGFIPDMVLYLSYFYKGRELPVRLSFFWTALTLTNITSAFLAYGILHLRGHHGWAGWRWLFLIEGVITATIGIISYFWLPASPTQTRGKLRGPEGWFSEREEIIMVNRILRDDPGKGGMNNRQALNWHDLWYSLSDYDNWPLYLIGLTGYIPQAPPTAYLTLTLKTLGFGTFNSNLLTIPSSVIFIINLLLLTQLSRILKERALVGALGNLWTLPFLLALEYLPSDGDPWIRFAMVTVLLGYPYAHAILVGWHSSISQSVRTRTVSAAVYNICVQAGNIISTHIYVDKDKPLYHRGNKILIGVCVFNIFLFMGAKVYYILRNKYKAKKWNAWTPEEKAHYLATTTDKGNKRLDFQFVH